MDPKLAEPHIFTVYVVALTEDGSDYRYGKSLTGEKYQIGSRVWGWYSTFESAEDFVLNQISSIFEGHYNYICIEEVPEKAFPYCIAKQWYRVAYKDRAFVTEKCSQPKVYKSNIVNFSMG